ncbi:tRNA pseudouridine(38-40) synthase TruA [Myxococcota bacterium]
MRSGLLLTVAYDGTSFSGWARQRHARTVAGELQGAVWALDPKASGLRGVSRTDAGVHARGQLAAFDTDRPIPLRGWVLGIARHLGPEISVVRAASVSAGFEPRAHVVGKTYRYLLLESPVRDPLLERRAWRLHDRLNHRLMAEEVQALLGVHDFAAFRSSADERSHTVRDILCAQVRRVGSDPRCIEVVVEADRFLYHMVRIIVGTLVDVGRGRLLAGAVARALRSGHRGDLGLTAPPDGLYLESVELDQPVGDVWPPAEWSCA